MLFVFFCHCFLCNIARLHGYKQLKKQLQIFQKPDDIYHQHPQHYSQKPSTMWFASCPQCALAIATTRAASVAPDANFSSSAGCRAARWAPRADHSTRAASPRAAKTFSPLSTDPSSTIHVSFTATLFYLYIFYNYVMLRTKTHMFTQSHVMKIFRKRE